MLDENFDKEEINALLEGKLPLSHFTHALKHSEDLEADVSHLLTHIALINNWPDNPELENLHDILTIIQQELIHTRPVEVTSTNGLHAIVVFANLLIAPGRSIGPNDLRAFELLTEVLELAPDYEYALASLAGLYLEGGSNIPRDPVKAHDLFVEAIRTRPDYPFALAHLGELLRVGDGEIEADALASYHYLQRAVDADPENAFALGSLGDLLKKGTQNLPKDPKRAYKLLSKAYEIDPYRPFVLASLADLLISGQQDVPFDPARAYELFESAVRLTQDNPFALAGLGDMLLGEYEGVTRDAKRALSLFEQAHALDPTSPYAMVTIAKMLLADEDGIPVDELRAKKLFEEALVLAPEYPAALANYGHLLRLGGKDFPSDRKKALELLQKAVSLAPEYGYALVGLGELYYNGIDETENTEDLDRAYECFEKAHQQNPSSTYALNHLAELIRLGTKNHPRDLPRASKLAKQSLLLDNNQPFTLWVLGFCYKYMEEGKDHILACGCFERALLLAPNYYSVLVELGLSLAQGDDNVAKNAPRAHELFTRALEIDPDDPYLLVQFAELLYDDTEYKDVLLALEYTKKAIDNNNGNSHPHSLFAHILISEEFENDYPLAYKHLELALALDPDNLSAMYYLVFFLKDGISGVRVDLERASALVAHALTEKPGDELFLSLQSEIIERMIERTVIKRSRFDGIKTFIKKVLQIK